MMTAGAAVSMTGNNVGQALSGSRNLFALAEQGDLPRWFGHIHPRYRTPDFAIVFTSFVALALALTGSFITLAATSAVARLLVYSGTCASVLALRRESRAPFTIPLGPGHPGGCPHRVGRDSLWRDAAATAGRARHSSWPAPFLYGVTAWRKR